MTGYTVHTGSTLKFSTSWDHIFHGAGSAKKPVSSGKAATKKVASKPIAAKNKGTAKKTVTKKTKRSK